MKLTIRESNDIRLQGIPYKTRKRLEDQGYEMDCIPVIYYADIDDEIELYDIVTNQKAVYVKKEDRLGNIILAYRSGFIDEFGKSNLPVRGRSFPNGIVIKII